MFPMSGVEWTSAMVKAINPRVSYTVGRRGCPAPMECMELGSCIHQAPINDAIARGETGKTLIATAKEVGRRCPVLATAVCKAIINQEKLLKKHFAAERKREQQALAAAKKLHNENK